MIEPCYNASHNRQDSCFTMTDVNGIQYYISLDLLKSIIIGDTTITSGEICTAIMSFPTGTPQNGDKIVMKTASGLCKLVSKDYFNSFTCDSVYKCLQNDTFCDLVKDCIYDNGFCDSVEVCLDNIDLGDKFCGIIRSYTGGTLQVGDSVLAIQNGVCKKLKVTSLGGTGKVYFEDTNCFHFAEVNDSTWTGNIIIDPDPENTIECRTMGLYSPSVCAQMSTIAIKDMENGLYVYTFDQGEDECYKSKLCLDGDANCVALSWQNVGGSVCISADLVISGTPDNILECKTNGAYVPSVCKQLKDWSDGGDLQDNDIVLVNNSEGNCVKKRYKVPVGGGGGGCTVANITCCDQILAVGVIVTDGDNPSCVYMPFVEFQKIFSGNCTGCLGDIPRPQDVNPLNQRISDLEKQNKALLKRLEKLEKKLK